MPKLAERMNIINVSAGKDSTVVALLALRRRANNDPTAQNLRFVFADTGNEHEEVYRYLEYLEEVLKIQITRIRADFTKAIETKRKTLAERWTKEGVPMERIQRTLDSLHATGIPFLDQCLAAGRFPSRLSRFCTEGLKVAPINEQITLPMCWQYQEVWTWLGIRHEESAPRSRLLETERGDFQNLTMYRPILQWKVKQVFDFLEENRILPNPLYAAGFDRVGCFPCIFAGRDELALTGAKYPEEVDRIERWEDIVSESSKLSEACLLADRVKRLTTGDVSRATHGIRQVIKWASEGADAYKAGVREECPSIHGLCE